MSTTTLTVQELEQQLATMKALLSEAKKANRPKAAVTAELHTAKESGKLSIAIGQGFRKAYLNADQVTFILDNQDSMKQMIAQLK